MRKSRGAHGVLKLARCAALLEASLLAGLARVGTEVVGAFEESVKEHPLIAMGTPDPYQPRSEP
jgi:hypothetical protein